MKKTGVLLAILGLFINITFSQDFTNTIRGTITDEDNKLPLIGATIQILEFEPIRGEVTDVNGLFRFENVPIGRVSLRVSYLGYLPKTIPNVIVNSGKEVVLNIELKESVNKLNEVVVKGNQNRSDALNNMAIISARSISAQETKRYAGTRDDPSIILNNFAGVASTKSGNNDIIVRGNSPKYIQWRLEGIEISAPNHQANQSSTIGGFSCLNNKLLSSSEFYTGAFSPEYGNVLSGIYDVNLRSGNNEKFEAMLGFGIMGTDFTVEGPIKENYKGSYVANYRFSNIGLIQEIGLVGDINGVTTTFQDANFKVDLPTNKMGKFAIFGLFGFDNLLVKDVKQKIWRTPGNNQMNPDLIQDFKKDNYLANFGLNHTYIINKKSYTKLSLMYSENGFNDDVFESTIVDDIIGAEKLNYTSRIKNSAYKGMFSYRNKLNSKNIIRIGTSYTLINESNKQSHLIDSTNSRFTLVDYNDNLVTVQNYISIKHSFNDNLSLVAGVHNANVLTNSKSTIEPRIAFNWRFNNVNTIKIGYGNHSTIERVHNYYVRLTQQDGSVIEPNKDLDLLKANHYILGYDRKITANVTAKVEVYYQQLYSLPVENNVNSYYSTLNEGFTFDYVDLVNEGTGKNYGAEITVERYFSNNYYFLINGSLFESKYTALDDIERNTKFNGNYLFNLLAGKEFDKLGKHKNKTFNLNIRIFAGGGQRYIPLLRDENGDLNVDPENNRYWDYSKAYENKLDDLFKLDLSLSYKINKTKVTHEFYLDLPNLTNNQSRMYEYFDSSEPDGIGYVRQMQFLPNIMYRMYF